MCLLSFVEDIFVMVARVTVFQKNLPLGIIYLLEFVHHLKVRVVDRSFT